jgi:iron complex transport system substrate-binding protein
MSVNARSLLLGPMLLFAAAVLATPSGVGVVDQVGNALRLTAPVKRIVTLSPHGAEIVFAVGAGDRLVGVSDFTDYPAEAARIDRVASGFGVDWERLFELAPDLVIAWHSGNGAATVERLHALGFNVYVTEPSVLEDVAVMLRDIGRLVGDEPAGAAAADAFEARIRTLRAEHRDADEVSVFYQISGQPLMTLNDRHMLADVLHSCGGRNVFGELSSIAPVVGLEDVLLRDPHVILLSSGLPAADAIADEWRSRDGLRAAAADTVYVVSADYLNRSGPRLVAAVEEVCRSLDDARLRLQGQ